jgi:hypothetical protein
MDSRPWMSRQGTWQSPRLTSLCSTFGGNCRNLGKNANDGFFLSRTVTDNENAQFETHPEQDDAVFIFRMVGVVELNGLFIEKNSARLIEGNAML